MIKQLICNSNLLIFKDYFEKQNDYIKNFISDVNKNVSFYNEDLITSEKEIQNEEKNHKLI